LIGWNPDNYREEDRSRKHGVAKLSLSTVTRCEGFAIFFAQSFYKVVKNYSSQSFAATNRLKRNPDQNEKQSIPKTITARINFGRETVQEVNFGQYLTKNIKGIPNKNHKIY